MQVITDLASEGRSLLDETTAVAYAQLQFAIRRCQFEFAEPKAGYGRAVLRVQVGFVGFIARIGRRPILLGGERMDNPCLESGTGECAFGKQVVVSGPLDHDDGVLNAVLLLRLANLLHCQLKEGGLVLDGLGFDEDVSKIVRHHPLRTMLGRIDADDAELVTAHLLDARTDHAIGLL